MFFRKAKVLAIVLLASATAFGQNPNQVIPVNQGSPYLNLQWPVGQFKVGFGIPLYPDTGSALAHMPDSLGLLIQIRSTGTLYRRDTTTGRHFWNVIGPGPGTPGTWGSITGSLPSQTDLMDSLNNRQYALGYRPIAPTDTGAMLANYLRASLAAALYYPLTGNPASYLTSNGLPNVVNSLQVINAGNGVSLGAGTYAARLTPGIAGRFYLATDSLKLYYDNGSTWLTVAGGGGGGGGAAVWGGITGTLSSQSDLAAALNARLLATNNLSDLNNVATAVKILGFVSVQNYNQTNAANLLTGLVPAGRLDTTTLLSSLSHVGKVRDSLGALIGLRRLISDTGSATGTVSRGTLFKSIDSIAHLDSQKVVNYSGSNFLGYGLYAAAPSSGLGFYFASDSLRLYYDNSGTKTPLTNSPTLSFTNYLRRKGTRGDSTLLTASGDTLYVAGIVDSGYFVHHINADGSYTFYAPAGGSGGPIDTARIDTVGLETPTDKKIVTSPIYVKSPSHTGAQDTLLIAKGDTLYAKTLQAGTGEKIDTSATNLVIHPDTTYMSTLLALLDSMAAIRSHYPDTIITRPFQINDSMIGYREVGGHIDTFKLIVGGGSGATASFGSNVYTPTQVGLQLNGSNSTYINTATKLLAGVIDSAHFATLDSLRNRTITGFGGGLTDPGGNGIVYRSALNTTTVAAAANFPILNQSTTGNAATATAATTAGSLSGASALPSGTTATSQAARDSSGKVATTLYVDAATSGGSFLPGITSTNGSATTLSADSAVWIRSGKFVSFSGAFTASSTLGTGGSCLVQIQLPIPSVLAGGHACFGTATTVQFQMLGSTNTGSAASNGQVNSVQVTGAGWAQVHWASQTNNPTTFDYTVHYIIQ